MIKPFTKTLADIYGTDTPTIPDGWEAGEIVQCSRSPLSTVLMTNFLTSEAHLQEDEILLELRRVPEPPKPVLVKYQFECEEGQTPVVLVTGGDRCVEPGEFFESTDGGWSRWIHSVRSTSTAKAFRRIEPSRVQ